jgi:hypothetical protein
MPSQAAESDSAESKGSVRLARVPRRLSRAVAGLALCGVLAAGVAVTPAPTGPMSFFVTGAGSGYDFSSNPAPSIQRPEAVLQPSFLHGLGFDAGVVHPDVLVTAQKLDVFRVHEQALPTGLDFV